MIITLLAYGESSCFCDFNWRKGSPCKPTNSLLLLENCCLNTTPDFCLSAAVRLSPSRLSSLFSLRKFLYWPLCCIDPFYCVLPFSVTNSAQCFLPGHKGGSPRASCVSFSDALDKKQAAQGQAFCFRPNVLVSSIGIGSREGECLAPQGGTGMPAYEWGL